MAKEMVVCANPHETRVAILEDGQLCEIYVEREKEFALVGSIYKGRVTRVLPGMQSSFVDIGLDSDAFLYVSDFLQDIEEVDSIVHTVEEKVQKMEEQGGEVFSAGASRGEGALEPVDVSPLPGETIGSPASRENLAAQEGSYAPAPSSGHRDRRAGGSENRGGFRDGRDRGRGGRGRFGRDRGRGGRSRGRELPEAKYAPSHGYDREQQGPAEPFEPVLIPGESLSVVREHSETPSAPLSTEPGPEAGAFLTEPEEPQPFHENAQKSAGPESESHEAESAEEHASGEEKGAAAFHSEHRHDFRRGGHRERHEQPRGWATALEPLPGESLAKVKTAEHEPADVSESNAAIAEPADDAPEKVHASEATDPAAIERHEMISFSEPTEENPSADLTDEEATALAEHVAEAQQEEAEREAEEARAGSAEFDENGSSAEASGAPDVPDEEDAEEEGASHDEHDEIHDEINDESSEANAEMDEEGEEENSEDLSASAESPGYSGEDVSEGAAEEVSASEAEFGSAAESQPPSEQGESQRPMQARVRGDFRARMQHPARRGGRDRGRGGRRHFHGRAHHHGQPRRNQLISELLKAGQEIIVQIAKEPLGKKGARITSHIALPGRFLVYMPTLDHTGVSRKIASAEERSRLRHLVTEAKGSAGGGFIVRTAAASAAPEEVRADVEFLTRTWTEIKSRSEQRKAPSLLHRDLNLVERILRDYLSTDYTSIWVDSEEDYTKILEFVSRFQPQLANRVKLFTKSTPIFEEFGIQQEIDKGLRPKVWLKSGGYIVINHTEALVAIDVNTGKFVGRGSTRLEDTIVRTNIEAVKEIVRQIRLRDLGGIIIIDFIDMEERRNREKVMAALEEALKADRAPSKVLRFNEFGLVAITRKRTKQALERTLCQPCPYCTGSGMVKSIPTLCYEIQSEARKMAPEIDAASITLRVHPEIAKALKTRESSLIEELEQVSRKSVIIQADPTLHWEQYDIY